MGRYRLAAIALGLVMTTAVSAQRGGGGGGDLSFGAPPMQLSRLERLELVFDLTKDQKKAAKAIFDAAHQGAAAARAELHTARGALGQTVVAAKPQAEVDAAAKAYGVPAAAMTRIEMQALADMIRLLTPDQRTNGAALRTAFSMVRGMFLDEKKWDKIPEAQGY